jgi:uncharacterized damage-inducible protein DinB
MSASRPEVWLRGPLAGFTPQAMPAAHSLLQTAEEVERAVRAPAPLAADELWARPGGSASVGYHLAHLAGSTDRLLTYAAGRPLDAAQLAALAAEDALLGAGDPGARPDAEALLAAARAALGRAVDAVRDTPPSAYAEVRHVGRARVPTTVWGLLFHVAEHAQRHAGQLATTARVARAPGGAAGGPR